MSTQGRGFRVAMVAPPCLTVPPRAYGGTELVVAELVDGLVSRGVQVTLFAAPGSRGGYAHGCELVSPLTGAVWPPSDEAELEHCRRAAEHIARDGRFDLVHAHCPAMVQVARELHVPTVLTVHHARTEAYSAQYARHPEVVYAFISARQQELEVLVPRSAVVHHGLDPRRYPFGPGGQPAAYLGRFSACKGLHHAIDAARMAHLPLLAAGRPHAEDGEYDARELQPRLVGHDVRVLGEADHAGKLRLLQHASALLFPVEWEEPFGLVLVESMLCGTPVIAYPRGSVSELVEEGLTGYLVDSPEEMAGALRWVARRGFDRRRCRARAAERFGQTAMVSRYLGLYARSLGVRVARPEQAGAHA